MGRPGAAKGGGGVGGSLHSLQHAAVVKVKAARTMDFTAVFRIRIGSGFKGLLDPGLGVKKMSKMSNNRIKI